MIKVQKQLKNLGTGSKNSKNSKNQDKPTKFIVICGFSCNKGTFTLDNLLKFHEIFCTRNDDGTSFLAHQIVKSLLLGGIMAFVQVLGLLFFLTLDFGFIALISNLIFYTCFLLFYRRYHYFYKIFCNDFHNRLKKCCFS